jgi:PIN domain nuclease of toxin-antitoxin system
VSDIVVDASAIIASIRDEPGGRQAASRARGARVSAVNYSEVIAWLAERGSTVEDAEAVIGAFDLTVERFDQARAMAAGVLAAKTRGRNISFGDRACLALALELGMPVMTGDRAWRALDIGVEVRLFR